MAKKDVDTFKLLLELYKKNANIMATIREVEQKEENELEDILYAYDLQSGSYRDTYYHGHSNNKYIGTEKVKLTVKEYNQLRCREIANVINQFSYKSILEVGVGEATTLADVCLNLSNDKCKIYGIDISYSRIAYGKLFLQEKQVSGVNLLVANMFELPFADSSIDIVYTYHAIEPNTNKAKEALRELYRVAKGYVILIEPSYELGNIETKRNIEKHKYFKNLLGIIDELGLSVVTHRIFEIGTYSNQSALTIIDKRSDDIDCNMDGDFNYSCPKCSHQVIEYRAQYFCENCSVIYPVIMDIPCFIKEKGILASKFLDKELNEKLWNAKNNIGI